MIEVDDREPAPLRAALFDACHQAGVPVALSHHPDGDFRIHRDGRVVIAERKTVSDLVSSLAGHKKGGVPRLADQLAGCTQHGQAFLIVEGRLQFRREGERLGLVIGGRVSGWSYLAIQNFISSLIYKGVGWVHTEDTAQTVLWVLGQYRWLGEERPEIRVGRKREGVSPALAVLSSVPGVGPATAAALLSTFPTIADICGASNSKIGTVGGVGAVTVRRLREALGPVSTPARSCPPILPW